MLKDNDSTIYSKLGHGLFDHANAICKWYMMQYTRKYGYVKV